MRTIDQELHAVAAANHHLVGRRQVRAAGLTSRQWARRVNDGEWVAMWPTVWRHVATPETWELRVRAGVLWLGRDAALAGRTAARWWGLEGFDADDVEFAVPRRRRGRGGGGVRVVRAWEARDLLRKDGVRVTSATRTILDLAGQSATAHELERAIDSGVRLRLTSVPTLIRRMQQLSGRGRRGTPLLRELLLDSGGESALERRFLRVVRLAGLPRPVPQVNFTARSGRVMRVDFLYEAARVVVEVSGRLGHTSDADRRKDARRRNELQQMGFVILEFTTADVIDTPDDVVATLRRSL